MEMIDLSASRMRTIQNCGLRYEYSYIQGIKSRPSVAMVLGTSTHIPVEQDLRRKIDTGALMSEEELGDVTAEAFDNTWSGEEPKLIDNEIELGRKTVRDRTKDAAIKLSLLYHRTVAPRLYPTRLERQFIVKLSDRVRLRGSIDVVEERITISPEALSTGDIEPRKSIVVRDLKTSKKDYLQSDVDGDFQLTAYGLAIKGLDGEFPAELWMDVMVKGDMPRVQQVRTERDATDYKAFMRFAEAAATTIETGAFMPADSKWWGCSKNYCGYWNQCPYGERQRSR